MVIAVRSRESSLTQSFRPPTLTAMKRLLRRNRPVPPLPLTDDTPVGTAPASSCANSLPNMPTSTGTLSNHQPTAAGTPRTRHSNPFAAMLQMFLGVTEEIAQEVTLASIERERHFDRIEAAIAQLREDLSTGIEHTMRKVFAEEREIEEIKAQNAHCARYCLVPLRGPNREAIPASIKFPQNSHELAVFTEDEINDLASFYQLDIPPNSPLMLRTFCILNHLGVNV
ncbi:hypothetical protein BD410DRAFT_900764 [Rickenella mellea]|uniref:Uncharacterized protein n=1 Tax=Rickenella mellea TaxID=50990 RepID=A0A4Y7PU19_9AGAM|nr:hypothetical protein BD410DRAFT_900764 [Rickenella mellea]